MAIRAVPLARSSSLDDDEKRHSEDQRKFSIKISSTTAQSLASKVQPSQSTKGNGLHKQPFNCSRSLLHRLQQVIGPCETLLCAPCISYEKRQREKAALARSEAVNAELKAYQRLRARDIKVAVLGSGQSGKTTVQQALKLHFEGDHTFEDAASQRDGVRFGIVEQLRSALDALDYYKVRFEDEITDLNAQVFRSFADTRDRPFDEVAEAIRVLYQTDEVWQPHGSRYDFNGAPNIAHFRNDICRITARDYVPTTEDVLLAPIRTFGFREQQHQDDRFTWRFLDFGYARGERRKWMHMFDSTHIVLFTVDITSSCERSCLDPDEPVSQLTINSRLFESIVNSRWFEKSTSIVLFTKIDLLEATMETHPPQALLPGLAAQPTAEDVKEYAANLFRAASPGCKEIYTFFISLTTVDEAHRRTIAQLLEVPVVEATKPIRCFGT